jgi:C4-dicarboxylate-specific signal transduction histidine kinase
MASIVHEIRQPLAAIIANGNAALRWIARTTPDLEEARRAMKRVVDDGHRAGDVIEGLRQALKGGRHSKELIDVNAIISRVTMLLRNEMKRHDIELSMELAKNPPSHVYGIEVQLQQVIFNLVVNAIEAMSKIDDRPHTLGIASRVGDSGQVLISVDDSGPGIDPKGAHQLFEPFFTTKQHGMGMGLSVCKSIIEAHGGQLSVVPRAPNGASFRIAIPLSEA